MRWRGTDGTWRGIVIGSALLQGSLCLAASEPVTLRGQVACLDDAGGLAGLGAECPDDPSGGWGLATPDGTLHRLSPADERVVMLTDTRVRSRELQIEAWRGEDRELAIVHLYTLVDGRLHDPHFYCEVCAIRAHTPGLCWCCQEPFEFREPPLGAGETRSEARPEP